MYVSNPLHTLISLTKYLQSPLGAELSPATWLSGVRLLHHPQVGDGQGAQVYLATCSLLAQLLQLLKGSLLFIGRGQVVQLEAGAKLRSGGGLGPLFSGPRRRAGECIKAARVWSQSRGVRGPGEGVWNSGGTLVRESVMVEEHWRGGIVKEHW